MDPFLRHWLERARELGSGGGGATWQERRASARVLSDRLALEFTAAVDPTARDLVEVGEVSLAGRTARRYRPAARGDEPLATQLYLHGGGFWSGSVHERVNDRLLAARSLLSGVQVYSLDYRLVPENEPGAAVEDTVDAMGSLLSGDVAGVDVSGVGLGGTSAGASIAAAASVRLRDAAAPVRHVHLEVPAVCVRPEQESVRAFSRGYGLDDPLAGIGDHPLLGSDAWAGALSGLPPTLVMTAALDPLRDGGEVFARRLARAGVDVRVVRGQDHLHATIGCTGGYPPARWWHRTAASELARHYGTTGVTVTPWTD